MSELVDEHSFLYEIGAVLVLIEVQIFYGVHRLVMSQFLFTVFIYVKH